MDGRTDLEAGLRGLLPCGRLLYVSDGKDYSAGRGQKPKFDVRKVAACMRAGMTDREIMRRTGIQSDSTLREYKRRARKLEEPEC